MEQDGFGFDRAPQSRPAPPRWRGRAPSTTGSPAPPSTPRRAAPARTFLPRAYNEIVGMSNIIMSSDRTWTLVRFLAPRDGAAKRHVRSGFFDTDRIGWTITRADIAHFLTGQLDDQRYLNAAPAVSN
jgi:hypothetical protein